MRHFILILTALLASVAAAPVLSAAQIDETAAAAAKTGKELIGEKASDEQRIDDCKVPVEKRTRPRSANCEKKHRNTARLWC